MVNDHTNCTCTTTNNCTTPTTDTAKLNRKTSEISTSPASVPARKVHTTRSYTKRMCHTVRFGTVVRRCLLFFGQTMHGFLVKSVSKAGEQIFRRFECGTCILRKATWEDVTVAAASGAVATGAVATGAVAASMYRRILAVFCVRAHFPTHTVSVQVLQRNIHSGSTNLRTTNVNMSLLIHFMFVVGKFEYDRT